jgi:hypothetical protein
MISKRVKNLQKELADRDTSICPCIAVKISEQIELSTSVTKGLLLLLTNLIPI